MSIRIYVVRRFRTSLPEKKERNVNKQDELVLQLNVTVRGASGDMQHATRLKNVFQFQKLDNLLTV